MTEITDYRETIMASSIYDQYRSETAQYSPEAVFKKPQDSNKSCYPLCKYRRSRLGEEEKSQIPTGPLTNLQTPPLPQAQKLFFTSEPPQQPILTISLIVGIKQFVNSTYRKLQSTIQSTKKKKTAIKRSLDDQKILSRSFDLGILEPNA